MGTVGAIGRRPNWDAEIQVTCSRFSILRWSMPNTSLRVQGLPAPPLTTAFEPCTLQHRGPRSPTVPWSADALPCAWHSHFPVSPGRATHSSSTPRLASLHLRGWSWCLARPCLWCPEHRCFLLVTCPCLHLAMTLTRSFCFLVSVGSLVPCLFHT